VWSALGTDRIFRVPAIRLAEAQAAHNGDVFSYLFTWPSPMMDGALGSCHALEIPFVFGTLSEPPTDAFVGDGPEARDLAANMQDAWLSFARSGRPAAPGLPEWPAYGSERRAT